MAVENLTRHISTASCPQHVHKNGLPRPSSTRAVGEFAKEGVIMLSQNSREFGGPDKPPVLIWGVFVSAILSVAFVLAIIISV
jgi:hypothetical protein